MATQAQGKVKQSGRLIILLLLFGGIGAVAGGLISRWKTSENQAAWVFLVQAPTGAEQIAGAGHGNIFVQDASGQVYSCNSFHLEQCWIADVLATKAVEPCDRSETAFQQNNHPPQDAISCIQYSEFVGQMKQEKIILALTISGGIWSCRPTRRPCG